MQMSPENRGDAQHQYLLWVGTPTLPDLGSWAPPSLSPSCSETARPPLAGISQDDFFLSWGSHDLLTSS